MTFAPIASDSMSTIPHEEEELDAAQEVNIGEIVLAELDTSEMQVEQSEV